MIEKHSHFNGLTNTGSQITLHRDLFEAAVAAMSKAYAPYSRFPVGVALRGDDGNIYLGANIENASYPEGWCAETTALGALVMGGAKRVVEMALVAEKMPRITPCGGCRQRLAEFATPHTRIHLCDNTGVVQSLALAELLPAAFFATPASEGPPQ